MNLQKMMQQAQEMQKKMTQMQAKLEAEETDGSSGGGMVRVRINGKHMMLKVDIDQSLLVPSEKEVLEDLLVAAYNDARGKVDGSFSEQMNKLSGELNLPPGFKLPF
jgi:hypothetical protein